MNIYYDIKRAYKDGLSNEEIIALYDSVEDKDQTFDPDGKATLLHLASQHADPVAVEFLISKGVKVNVVNDYDYTPLRSMCNLRDVITSKYTPTYDDIYKTTCLLLDAKVSTLRKDESGNPCAVVAAERGILPMIQAFIDKGAKIGMTGRDGKTPLHAACDYVRHEISSVGYAKSSLEKRMENAKKTTGSEAFDRLNKEAVVEAEKDFQQKTEKVDDYFKIVTLLVENGFDTDAKDNANRTPLDYAVTSDAKKIAAFLKGELDENNPDSIIAGGMTLHQAIMKDDLEAVKALIRSGADLNEVNDAKEFEGETPLATACKYVRQEMVQVLLDGEADPNLKTGEHGASAIGWLICKSSMNIRLTTYENKSIQKIIKHLIAAGWNKNDFVNDEAFTALAMACKTSGAARYNSHSLDRTIVECLLEEGCDVNMANNQGQTPLMFMLLKDMEDENQLITLLENEARLDVADKQGRTPLMYAVSNSNQGTARTFIEIMSQFGNLKIEAVDNEGKTALELATNAGYEEVVKLLLSL